MTERNFDYDVGLSFAGEQREFVEQVAENLKSRGIRVFFDDYEQDTMWGKDLYTHLSDIYQNSCRYCVIFISQAYADKVWTNREREGAQSRALEEHQEYILPARFDDTPIPGILPTIHYIDLRTKSPSDLGDLIAQKVGKDIRVSYLPPRLDRLYEHLELEDDPEVHAKVYLQAASFFDSLRRMEPDEKDAVFCVIRFGCHHDFPEDIHISADLLRRHTGKSVSALKRILGGLRSLGFSCTVRESTTRGTGQDEEVLDAEDFFFHLNWYDLHKRENPLPDLKVAGWMVLGATEHYCEEHGQEFLDRLDFSQLASATVSREGDKSA